MENRNNPFDITKAVDFTNEEIATHWVNIDGNGFEGLLKPTSPMPIIIRGSKGSGKTHIMRYFSYELQKIRHKEDLKSGLEQDKFIGVYIRCSGFNAEMFSGKGYDEDTWATIHSYYWELWIGETLLTHLIDLRKNGILSEDEEQLVTNKIEQLFNSPMDNHLSKNFYELRDKFIRLQNEVVYEIQNFIFKPTRILQLDIRLSPTKITYGIPSILKNDIPFFKDKCILYLIDELENFSIPQQQLIQSLLREKPNSCSFRIGSRLHGIRTYQILGGIEENRPGAEFDEIILDEFLRELEGYNDFVRKICENRLRLSGYPDYQSFQSLIMVETSDKLIDRILKRKSAQNKKHFIKLSRSLKIARISEDVINQIISNLIYNEDIVLERTKLLLFYRYWRKKSVGLLEESYRICQSAKQFISTKDATSEFAKVLDKFKLDIIDSLARDANIDIPYYGFDKLVQLSCGTPRTMLNLLKYAFNSDYFNSGNLPFKNNHQLSISSQQAGIDSTIKWFFEENRIPSFNGIKPTDAAIRLGNYLRELRFSDVPSQCSIGIFSVNLEELSNNTREIFNQLVNHSYIIEVKSRREKNNNNKVKVFQLNHMLLPKWELPLGKRGLIELNKELAEAIFSFENPETANVIIAKKIKEYNAPFSTSAHDALTLF